MGSRSSTVLTAIRAASLMAFGGRCRRVRSGLVIGALLGGLCLAGIGGPNAAAQDKPAPICLDDDVKKEIARLEKQALDMRIELGKLRNQETIAKEQLGNAADATPYSREKLIAAEEAVHNITLKIDKLLREYLPLLRKIAKLKLLPPCAAKPAPGPGGAVPGPGGGPAPGKPADRCRTPAVDAEIARLEQKLGELEKEEREAETTRDAEEGQLRNMQRVKAAGQLLQDQEKNVAAANNKLFVIREEIAEAKRQIAALKALPPCPPPPVPAPGGIGEPGKSGPEKGAAPGGPGGAGGAGVKPPEPPRAPELPGAEQATAPSGRGPFAVNFGFGLLGLVPSQSFNVHGTVSGDLSKTNSDFQAMPALNLSGVYRTNLGISLASGVKVAFPTGNTFTATGMTTGGFDAVIKSRIDAPIVAPYLGLGGRIANVGTLFGSVGAWGEQDRVSVGLSVPGFSEQFNRNRFEWRPFGAVGFIAPWEIANLTRMEVVSELMWVGSGSRRTLPGGNAFSFAQFQARDSFAFRLGVQWRFDPFGP